MLRLVSSPAGAADPVARPRGVAAGDEIAEKTWPRPRGFGLAVLLAMAFWLALGLALAWLL